jgi:hypothetical protein
MKLSDQALGAIMMALQKSLLELMDDGELLVKNPPHVSVPNKETKPTILVPDGK